VIGAGRGGKAAAQAAEFGERVAALQRSQVPRGTPATTGRIPTMTIGETSLYLTGSGDLRSTTSGSKERPRAHRRRAFGEGASRFGPKRVPAARPRP